MLGVNSSAEGELCNTLCMCRLTRVWILAKLPQSNWNADSIFFHWSGPYLLPTGLSAPVSGVDCLVRGPAPTANFELLCPSNSLFASPSTSGHGEISSPKPFVWFRAKTDKGIVCLAGHLHSVTKVRRWLGLPRCFSSTALYGRTNTLQLLFKQLEFMVTQIRDVLQYRDLRDPKVAAAGVEIQKGKKWNTKSEKQVAEEGLRHKAIVGTITKGRSGLSYQPSTQIPKAGSKEYQHLL